VLCIVTVPHMCAAWLEGLTSFVQWWMTWSWSLLQSREFISALGGAFCGTGAAFLLESRRRRREKIDREYEAVLGAQAVLLSQGNSLACVYKQYPEGTRFDNLKTIVLGLTRQLIDFKGLAFLGKSSDPQLLIELDVANETYDQFRRLVEYRNETIEDFFRHPETEIVQFNKETGEIGAKGSPRLTFKLRQTNEALSKALVRSNEVNRKTIDRLLLFARTEFPGKKMPYPSNEGAVPS